MVKLLKRAIITEWKKISHRFVDGLTVASTSGAVVFKKVEYVGMNDCEHDEQCNNACIAAFIKQYCYIAMLMGH